MSNPTIASIIADVEATERVARGRGSPACDHLAGRLASIRGELQQIAEPQPGADAHAAQVLAAHNEWRRFNGETGVPGAPEMGDPAEIGRAIDHVVSRLRAAPQPPAEAQPVGGDLLPCPFCGSDSADTGGMLPWVECTDCDASGPSCGTEEEAVAAWNRRTPPPSAPVAWVVEVAKCISQYGLSEEAAAVFAASELDEYRAGECDCAEHAPTDMADLMMGVAADAVEKWKAESVGRVWGFKPPSAPVGVDVRSVIARAIGCGYSRGHQDTMEGKYTDVGYKDRVEYHGELADDLLSGDPDFAAIGLAQQPAAVGVEE